MSNEVKTSTPIVFAELDPLGNHPYVDKKDFFQDLKNPPKKVLKDLVTDSDLFQSNTVTENGASKAVLSDDSWTVPFNPFAGDGQVAPNLPPRTVAPLNDAEGDQRDSEPQEVKNPFNPFLVGDYPEVPPPSSPHHRHLLAFLPHLPRLLPDLRVAPPHSSSTQTEIAIRRLHPVLVLFRSRGTLPPSFRTWRLRFIRPASPFARPQVPLRPEEAQQPLPQPQEVHQPQSQGVPRPGGGGGSGRVSEGFSAPPAQALAAAAQLAVRRVERLRQGELQRRALLQLLPLLELRRSPRRQ
ncbi:protein disabled [Caerostris extrusa]|uniref:Protein disabled n=1 Tax=Caerostris extrusa TaxID=172846 RepID=A0AAV4RS74_CAEEX|nr:protein disabled [Caerostris extrusa]